MAGDVSPVAKFKQKVLVLSSNQKVIHATANKFLDAQTHRGRNEKTSSYYYD